MCIFVCLWFNLFLELTIHTEFNCFLHKRTWCCIEFGVFVGCVLEISNELMLLFENGYRWQLALFFLVAQNRMVLH